MIKETIRLSSKLSILWMKFVKRFLTLSEGVRLWLRIFFFTVAAICFVMLLYHNIVPFYGVDLKKIEDNSFDLAFQISVVLGVLALFVFGLKDQKYQKTILKFSLFPLLCSVFFYLSKGSIHDFATFLSLSLVLQGLGLFVVFSHVRPIGKTLFISIIFLLIGYFYTESLRGYLPNNVSNVPKQVDLSPSPIPSVPEENNVFSYSPRQRVSARISFFDFKYPEANRIPKDEMMSIFFYDSINNINRGFEYKQTLYKEPRYIWSDSGDKFAVFDGSLLRIFYIQPLKEIVGGKREMIITMSEFGYTDNVYRMFFSGDDSMLYMVLQNDDTYGLVSYNLATKKIINYDTNEDESLDAVSLPGQAGYATTISKDGYKRQVVFVTSSGKKIFSPVFESDYFSDLIVSPSLNGFCVSTGSSGSHWFSIVINDKIIKVGDGSCKDWLDRQNVMLYEDNNIETIFNVVTKKYVYQGSRRNGQ